MTQDIIIKAAQKDDFDSIWQIFSQIIKAGDSFIYDDSIDKTKAYKIWMEDTHPFIVVKDDKIVATYVIRANKIGRGSHICNAGFMVAPEFQGVGIGRIIGMDALKKAKELGFKAMQFNIVVSTNKRSIALWQSLGFKIIGTIPQGFRHKEKGLVDFHIMYRAL